MPPCSISCPANINRGIVTNGNGSNAVHGLINFQNNSINNDKLTFLLSEDGYKSLIATTSALPVDVSVSISHDNGLREESGFDQQKLQLKYFNRFNGWNINWLSSFNNLVSYPGQ